MRSVGFLALALVACGNGKEHEHRDGDVGPAYWTPQPGETSNWDIQIHDPIDVSAERDMYIVDLFSVVPAATTIDYASDSVPVPAGTHANVIATLQARPDTIIVCRVGVGAIRLTDPDASKFPGFATDPPDDPDLPAAGSVIGWNTLDPDEPNERYLDPAQRAVWQPIVFARFDLAKAIGCDAIEPYLTDLYSGTGFADPTEPEQSGLYAATALAIHERELSAGMRNGFNGFIDGQVGNFDWLLVEGCGEAGDCEVVRPFLNARKAVFGLDFNETFDGDALDPTQMCDEQIQGNIQDGIVKNLELSSAFRQQCAP